MIPDYTFMLFGHDFNKKSSEGLVQGVSDDREGTFIL